MLSDEIALSGPDISHREIQLVNEVLRSGRLSIGPMQERFEQLVADRSGCQHGIAVSSGTSGLHLVLHALGIGPGDEVITTPFSFVASANVIVYTGATPVFVDLHPTSLNMDPDRVEAAITPKTKAILAVEALGNPAHMDAYAQIAAKHEVPLIEDSCEALGGSHAGRPCGSFGRAGVFGFYPNKQVTTGEGGMIVTDDSRLAELCRSLRNQGRPTTQTGSGRDGSDRGSWLAHERIGYNARLSEIAAAIGIGQMERLDELLMRRKMVAELYFEKLADHPDLVLPTVDPKSDMSWFVFVCRLAAGFTAEERDRVIKGLRNHDIGSAPYFPCIHLQPPYREMFGFREGLFPIAESVSQRTLALPFHTGLSEREIDLVAQTLGLMLTRQGFSRG
ncbi:MAG: DegT/DnrJ/EryC1/StrS family aminotransferase [Planctomycetota bacterium]